MQNALRLCVVRLSYHVKHLLLEALRHSLELGVHLPRELGEFVMMGRTVLPDDLQKVFPLLIDQLSHILNGFLKLLVREFAHCFRFCERDFWLLNF
jgi:hypothetical protein